MKRGLILVGLLFITVVTWAQVVEYTAPVDDYYFFIEEYSLTNKGLKEDALAFIRHLESTIFNSIKEVALPRAFWNKCYNILWDEYSYLDMHRPNLNSPGGCSYLYPGIYCFLIFHKYSGSWKQYAIFIIVNKNSEVEFDCCYLVETIGS